MYDFTKEMYFDVEARGNKSSRDKSRIGLLKSPSIKLSSSGVATTHKRSLFQNHCFCHLIPTNYVID